MFYRQRKRIPIYDSFYLDIVISDDIKKLNKITGYESESYFAQAGKSNFKTKSDKGTVCYKKSVTVILNPNNEFSIIDSKVIVHESVHVKNIIFRHLGYKQKDNNDEAEAYFTEWIFSEIENFYNKVILKENETNKKDSKS